MNAPRWIVALIIGLLLASGAALGQSYPDKPVRLVVPWPPGGSVDIIGRLIGVKLGQTLGQAIVIENRSGASGNIGMDTVAKSRPDGYTLVLNTIPLATNPSLSAQMPFDVSKDFRADRVDCENAASSHRYPGASLVRRCLVTQVAGFCGTVISLQLQS